MVQHYSTKTLWDKLFEPFSFRGLVKDCVLFVDFESGDLA
jgi:hypothetical protein